MASAFLNYPSHLENNLKSFKYDHKILKQKRSSIVLEGVNERVRRRPLRRVKRLAAQGKFRKDIPF